MARKTTLTQRFGDFCFRQPYTGQDPDTIRSRLDEESRAVIERSVRSGLPAKAPRPTWYWLEGTA